MLIDCRYIEFGVEINSIEMEIEQKQANNGDYNAKSLSEIVSR